MTEADKRLSNAREGGKKAAALRREQAATLTEFQAYLLQLIPDADPVKRAMVRCAVVLYAPLLKRSNISSAPSRHISPLHLSACVTGLRNILRELGIVGSAAPDDQATEDLSDLVERFTGKGKGVTTDASAHVAKGSTAEPE